MHCWSYGAKTDAKTVGAQSFLVKFWCEIRLREMKQHMRKPSAVSIFYTLLNKSYKMNHLIIFYILCQMILQLSEIIHF